MKRTLKALELAEWIGVALLVVIVVPTVWYALLDRWHMAAEAFIKVDDQQIELQIQRSEIDSLKRQIQTPTR